MHFSCKTVQEKKEMKDTVDYSTTTMFLQVYKSRVSLSQVSDSSNRITTYSTKHFFGKVRLVLTMQDAVLLVELATGGENEKAFLLKILYTNFDTLSAFLQKHHMHECGFQ